MYRNRDIVNGQEANNDSHLSENYLLDNLNNVNSGGNEMNSDFDTSLDTTSTTHFVVIDKNGKLASTTNTLSSFFGSGKFVKQGFYMNNSLTNFSSDPNSPNYGGKHKAPRSYTSPSIVVGPDFYMGIGTPGGNKIPTILNEVLIDYLRGDGTLQESIDKPRFITMVVQFIMRMRQVMKISIHSRVWDMVLKKNVMTQTLVVFKVQYIIKMIKLLKLDKMLVIDNGLVILRRFNYEVGTKINCLNLFYIYAHLYKV